MSELIMHQTTVKGLKKGDIVFQWNLAQTRPLGTVKIVDRRQTRGDVYLEHGPVVKHLLLDTEVTVQRLEKTAEEKAQERTQSLLWAIDRAEKGVQEDLVEQQQKVAALLASGQRLDHWKLEELLRAQATAAIWAKVAHVHLAYAQRTEEDIEEMRAKWGNLHSDDVRGPMTRLEALDFVAEKTQEWLIEQSSYLNRSTSVVSNLMDDVDRQVAADFLRHRSFKWF